MTIVNLRLHARVVDRAAEDDGASLPFDTEPSIERDDFVSGLCPMCAFRTTPTTSLARVRAALARHIIYAARREDAAS